MNKKEITEFDMQEIGRLVAEGNTSGQIDNGEFRIGWELKAEIID